MEEKNVSSDQVIAELIGMGFELSDVTKAIEAVGPSLDNALEFILDGSRRSEKGASTSSSCIANSSRSLPKRAFSAEDSSGKMRQSSIVEHLKLATRPRRSMTSSDTCVSGVQVPPRNVGRANENLHIINSNTDAALGASIQPSIYKDEEDIGPDWEQKVQNILLKHFGFSSLKSFQKEALAAWLAHKDCLVLAATGSGKSLCFQIPALLTGKVVIVISPLISLMHDQCLKLAKHGVSACFLGSGQIDKSVEQKAMRGMYNIVYVCPETILRLMKPLQSLAESCGIALFAIDEVHCVSKWGHDFRPDYRRLSVLREYFNAESLKFLKFDIPLMALTATATIRVREDILKSLCMSEETKIVLTSFFRPNLRFSVKHSRTTSPSSYKKDFQQLIEMYTKRSKSAPKNKSCTRDLEDTYESSAVASNDCNSELEEMYESEIHSNDDDLSENDEEADLVTNGSTTSEQRKLSVEYLEDECDLVQEVDDLDVSCGEFYGESPRKDFSVCVLPGTLDFPTKIEERLELQRGPVGEGPTIIYVPTRKETLNISKFLCKFGVKAAAYNAKLPKSHLRHVHKEFHENVLQVVVATIAFGMGIDKLNVRRIIHYGWPQSLEAYYQEAGRAGRDGKLADCVLYANLLKIPTLLPSHRSEEQTKQAYRMLSDCFRYGMFASHCRAKTLVEYFGEEFHQEKCFLCDICVNGPPEMQNLRAEATVFMQVVAALYRRSSFEEVPSDYEDGLHVPRSAKRRHLDKANFKTVISRIREQHAEFAASDLIWWRGLARILDDKGFIREGDDMNHVQVKFPQLTELGLKSLRLELEQPFCVYPEADMLLVTRSPKSYSSFAEWGRGWADPEIRRQRLASKQTWRKPKKRKSHKIRPNPNTVRGRLATKLFKQKR